MDNEPAPKYEDHEASTHYSFVDALKAEDPDAWSQFADVWGKVLNRYYKGRRLDRATAEDLIQDVLAKIVESMQKGWFSRDGEKCKVKHFVFMIAKQRLATHYNEIKERPHSPGGSDFQEYFANVAGFDDSDESEDFETIAIVVLLDKIKAEVKEESWQAFYWSYFDNLTHKEIGEKLGISPEAAKLRIHRIRERIRKELDTEIVTEE